jgi:hypothetical protein
MVRRGWSLAPCILLAAGLLAACSDDGGGASEDGPPTTGVRVDATLPPIDDVAAGEGALVLDGRAYALDIRVCTLAPAVDPTTQISTELAIDADDELGVAVSLTRSVAPGDVPTVSDRVTIVVDGVVAEANRAEVNGRFIDLFAEGALTPLISVDGEVVTAEGVFGPPGARPGDPGLVEGSLVLRCQPGG